MRLPNWPDERIAAFNAAVSKLYSGAELNREERRLIMKRLLDFQRAAERHYMALLWAQHPLARQCEAEDMGGYRGCPNPGTLQTRTAPRHYYCEMHRFNRHVWWEDELEPIPPDFRELFDTQARELCDQISQGMAKLGVITTAHYDAGLELIAAALRAAYFEGVRRATPEETNDAT